MRLFLTLRGKLRDRDGFWYFAGSNRKRLISANLVGMNHLSSAATSSIVALLSANQCRFLSSISQLVSFLEELRNVLKTSPSNLPCAVTEKKREDANAYACLKEVLQCVLSTLENINGNRDCSEISETENLLSTVETKSISDLFKYVCSFFIDPFLKPYKIYTLDSLSIS